MKRRTFIQRTALATSGLTLPYLGGFHTASAQSSSKKLAAYYFRAHMYTLVPRQIAEDMKWMAHAGTDIVYVGILEQDLYAAKENVTLIIEAANKEGMEVHIIPSRWGGLVAGAPKVPSTFSATHPETWMLKEDGTPIQTSVSGVISSIHHEATYDFMAQTAAKCLDLWDIKGIIWDEPKTLQMDYSPAAKKALGDSPSWEAQLQANVDFYSRLNAFIKEKRDVTTSLFIFAHLSDQIAKAMGNIKHLDYYGCDGRPWHDNDGGETESKGKKTAYAKTLLGSGERFLDIAHANKKKSVWLIENHNMRDEDTALMDRRLPEIIKKPVDMLIYYYYPRNLASPELNMKTLAKHIKRFK